MSQHDINGFGIQEGALPRINPLESGLYITSIIFSTLALMLCVYRLFQKGKWYGFYFYLLLAAICQLAQSIISFLDRGFPQSQIKLGPVVAFTTASLSKTLIWCTTLLTLYRIFFRATTKYYSDGGIAREKWPALLMMYSLLTFALLILSVVVTIDAHSSRSEGFFILNVPGWKFVCIVYEWIYPPLFIYYTIRYSASIHYYYKSFVFIGMIQILRLVPDTLLIYFANNTNASDEHALLSMILKVVFCDFAGIFIMLYMLIVDGEAQWLDPPDRYALTSSNTVIYAKPNYYEECPNCDRRYSLDDVHRSQLPPSYSENYDHSIQLSHIHNNSDYRNDDSSLKLV